MCIKSEVEEMFLKLATNNKSDEAFLLTSNFWPNGLSAPAGAIYMYKIMKKKKVHKIGGQRYVLKNAIQ